MVLLNDKVELTSKRIYTDSGQMIVPCAFARTGTQVYTAESLALTDKEPNELVEVHREPSEVFDESSMGSFRSVPVTIGHPQKDGEPISVTSKNSRELQVGMLEGLPVRDEDLLTGVLVVSDQEAINTIEEGTVELSAGYTCKIEMRDGKYYQTQIVANHVAIVPKGRAGSSCMIADQATNKPNPTTEVNMKEKENQIVTDNKVDLTDTVAKLTDSLEALKAQLDASELDKAKLNDSLKSLKDELEVEVKERTEVILMAHDMTDLKDFESKTVKEIKSMIVADVCEVDVTDKSEAYIQARLDILVEDSDKAPTDLGKMIKAPTKEEAPATPVISARDAMIKRNSNYNKGAE